MQIYVVGGAVRDELLGLPVQDHDHVVVGATPEEMVQQGFRPVGKDFPVFLHPTTHEEYALARTERKTAPGYKGFVFHTSPDVTLEQDLVRRDLTINAIAKAGDGALIDPFNGRADIAQRIFRHVSDAFAEDPVRILRVARFAARYSDFTVAPETNALMRHMVELGEVDALVAERVWQEVSRGLMEAAPSRMFAVLRDCGALARIMPEYPDDAQAMQVADYAAASGLDLPVRFAAWLQGLDVKAVEQLCKRLKVPAECRDLAVMAARERGVVADALALDAGAIVKLLERCDGFRKPARFSQMLQAVQAGACAGKEANCPYPQRARLEAALSAARAVNAGGIALSCADNPSRIPDAVHGARVAAVHAALA
ncbi:multifunctional CCA tRNA nucleotidyl transferase/2'3'-cyclic phosphodiesterase/2'nucleotidase/phosphatase [Pseudoduganella ginsengisoli]|uniref:Multifunctional CCA tRNA nucleotidyl transferase/2'3'-cyclic phosphodiesterase/2'nucleotidase/phosphatase n=1 Tax=Pseudoduganella ginsengisoli TaxID=1462440 RepID=A0A6L6Q135_9BURK|nr:multifunctional CCA tRNA nucleotidyl transferase/2'3'-cyclic phosphodiesterase/2'nucleotidase/phosphatase [Pseudoduganella ginsengisoli]MTW03563.1 multifunctional CCA tRNA nucleotidyl transferase/2'3'-cyclic phosphodiesterase/2'nucleotidase/phosphatase [Pseudoduganella ginsengisoli]